ncbi:hypothetical protein LZC95_41785 [Pendulispora brunnea]|uniref:Uncharacterized protein n=1 Tax=Pendulispora brunnea TaxID=2905690 RepID=A0ABZ2K2N0_9BACT
MSITGPDGSRTIQAGPVYFEPLSPGRYHMCLTREMSSTTDPTPAPVCTDFTIAPGDIRRIDIHVSYGIWGERGTLQEYASDGSPFNSSEAR